MSWTYEVVSGRLYSDDGELIAKGYAGGNKGQVPEAVNNPEYQSRHEIGPLPSGAYTIDAPYDHPQLGPYVMNLVPAPENEMFGRGDFRIHGDNSKGDHSASEGCIILPRDVRNRIWLSGDRSLDVVDKVPEGYFEGG